MLGQTLSDPHHVEAGGQIEGMGLLPMDTVFEEAKTRTRVCGQLCELTGVLKEMSGVPLEGYEIHMGESVPREETACMSRITDQVTGAKKVGRSVCRECLWNLYPRNFDLGGSHQRIDGSHRQGERCRCV